MLRGSGHFLNMDRPQHHFMNPSDGKRSGQRKRPTFHPLRSGTICVQPYKHWHCFEGSLGNKLRARAERGWDLPIATMSA